MQNRPIGLPRRSPVKTLEQWIAEGRLPRGWIDGLTLSNDTTDATNDIAIAAGVARSTVNIRHTEPSTLARDQVDLDLPVGIIKQLDVAWAPENYDADGYSGGDRSGGRSGSSISNTTWHVYLIGGAGLPTDVMFHDSATQSSVVAQLPTGYTAYRRIGSVVRSGGAILAFTQRNDEFEFTTPVLDIAHLTPGTSANTGTLATLPTGIVVKALLTASVGNGGSRVYLSPLTTTDQASSSTSAPLSTINASNVASADIVTAIEVWTNTSAQIRYRAALSAPVYILTRGYKDTRGRDA